MPEDRIIPKDELITLILIQSKESIGPKDRKLLSFLIDQLTLELANSIYQRCCEELEN